MDSRVDVAVGAGTACALGCYELLLPLGSGGMAAVWTARKMGSRGFHKIVAVKVMHDRLRQSGAHERMFLDEARIAARIKHPNVVEIYDLGEQDGVLYQVMEWVDGETLSALFKACKGKIPVPIAVQIAVQVAAGLHAAHQARDEDDHPLRLVHRDVSPQNILIGFDGAVKILDFGVAKAISNTSRTAAGQLKGKVSYMSPEQASGHSVDRRTDIFVLGVVLYQITTGHHPFRRDSDLETFRRLIEGSPTAPVELDPDYPRALNDILLQALHRDPLERYASMADLMRALESALPPSERLSAEDLGAFMRSRLGEARKRKRDAIRQALTARGESLSSPGSSPSLPSLSTPPSEPASATPGDTMVISTRRQSAPERAPDSERRLVHPILLALTAAVLGCAAGLAGAHLARAPAANSHAPASATACPPPVLTAR